MAALRFPSSGWCHAGFSGSGFEVYGLRIGLCVHRRGTAVLSREGFQERTQTLQSVQGETAKHSF
jgi:hypothetical protein